MMGSSNGSGQVVPPGFRFHPTDDELLWYYLRKKVSYQPIDLDVIREIDLNKLEPWDLNDKCAIGSGPQNEWYFFSHKDKKYPTGTRTNRATIAGFWKATGRDKAIHHTDSKRIGMRKTLVFYTGRAPHGHKTDWIMHEYRLHDDIINLEIQEEGWVVCRVFKKKPHIPRDTQPFHHHHNPSIMPPNDEDNNSNNTNIPNFNNYLITLDHDTSTSLHLPQLLSPDTMLNPPSLIGPLHKLPGADEWPMLGQNTLNNSKRRTINLQMNEACYNLQEPQTAFLPFLPNSHGFDDFSRYPK